MSNLKVGDDAPDFQLITGNNQTVNLSSLLGKNIILYFYPKDDTPGCTIEAKAFNELKDEFHQLNAIIIGVSKDSLESHKKFKTKYCLEFELASDSSGDACMKYGTLSERSIFGIKSQSISRSTFLIDKAGKIAYIWPKVTAIGHAQEVLIELKKLP